MKNENDRFKWGSLAFGLLIGLAAGVVYAWFLNPVEWVNISPDRLGPEEQREYIQLVADAYWQDKDIDRARERLARLGVRNPAELVSVQADSAMLRGADPYEVRALTALAEALGQRPLAAEVFSGTAAVTPTSRPHTSTPTFEGMPSPTPSRAAMTVTPTATIVPATSTPDLLPPDTIMSLSERETVCEDEYPSGLIEIYVYNQFEEGVPGVEIVVEWDGGLSRFFTGMKPEIEPGYADFEMVADEEYTVTLVGLGEPVLGIRSRGCRTPDGRTSMPTYQLVFVPRG